MPTDDELRQRLTDHEDALVERKRAPDNREEIRDAVVAFANSVTEPSTGILFLGVEPDGTPSGTIADPDKTQQNVRRFLQRCYPPIVYQTFAFQVGGQNVVAIEVPATRNGPHFAGPAAVRIGSSTEQASEEVFQQLVERRLSKVDYLRRWVGKKVSVLEQQQHGNVNVPPRWPEGQAGEWTLKEVNAHFVLLVSDRTIGPSLERVQINFDGNRGRPLLRITL
jgi:predicted HTH transcriptional regulator